MFAIHLYLCWILGKLIQVPLSSVYDSRVSLVTFSFRRISCAGRKPKIYNVPPTPPPMYGWMKGSETPVDTDFFAVRVISFCCNLPRLVKLLPRTVVLSVVRIRVPAETTHTKIIVYRVS